jgi:hypothetical protein
VRRLAPLVGLLAIGCVDPATTNVAFEPTWEVNNVKSYAQTVAGSPPDTAYGWGFVVEGDTARWHECASADTCGDVQRERPKGDVLAIERVGQAPAGDGGWVYVMRLSLAPGRKYVVPYVRPVRTTTR